MVYLIYPQLKKERIMKRIFIMLCLTGCTFGMFAKKTPKIVREADELYSQGRYEDALSAYSIALSKYPKKKKLRLKFAKTLYRLERYEDSYKIFKDLDPKIMNNEENFESGMSAFSVENYKMASVNFSYIKANFELFDIACYYGGVASYNLGQHDIARQYFSKATVLPSRLMKNKQTYIYFMNNPPKKGRSNDQPEIYNDNPNKYDFLHQK